jgi:ketosteroid isomerase-like protein
MSQGNVEAARKPLQVRERSRRAFDERLALRFPRLAAAFTRLIARLPPSSRLRQAILWRACQLANEAYNRRDLDAVVIGFDPEIEYRPGADFVKAGMMEASYRGHQGYREYTAAASEVWGEENRMKPVELIDLGSQFVLLAYVAMRAQASGVPLTQPFAYVATLTDGKITRLQEYFDHEQALKAAGLSE